MSPDITVISAPGKVLIAGGYLVLDPAYAGVVVSTSSRFYTAIQGQTSAGPNQIVVKSPQFTNAAWNYGVAYEPSVAVEPRADSASKNKFVHLALHHTLALVQEIKGKTVIQEKLSKGLEIVIVGGNDFYSQRAKLAELGLPRTLKSLSSIPPFTPTGVQLSDVHKTGLGSSAALITSLVTALLLHLSAIQPQDLTEADGEGRHLAHNTAQFIHCLAQGKIGSGFDVSAAVFGSHLYRRFDPATLQELMNDNPGKKLLPVLSPSNKSWNYRIDPFQLPPFTRLMLADVDAGSDTPSLVGKLLKWRKEDSEIANKLWTDLDQLNTSLAQNLLAISQLHAKDPENYGAAVQYLASVKASEWEKNHTLPESIQTVISSFYKAHQITEAVRAKMREMGSLAGVPVEPIEQTRLLDACVSQEGIIGGGVPGAGGYDAIWLLAFEPQTTIDPSPVGRIEQVWSTYTELDVSPLSVVESKARGARLENVADVVGLQDLFKTS